MIWLNIAVGAETDPSSESERSSTQPGTTGDSGIAYDDGIDSLLKASKDSTATASNDKKEELCTITVYSANSISIFVNAYYEDVGDPYSKATNSTHMITVNPGRTEQFKVPCTGNYVMEATPLGNGKAFGMSQCKANPIPLNSQGAGVGIVYPSWFHANCTGKKSSQSNKQRF